LVEDATAPGTAPDTPLDVPVLRIGLKSDLLGVGGLAAHDLLVSNVTGAGLEELCGLIGKFAADACGNIGDPVPVRQRQEALLAACAAHLGQALDSRETGLELRAEELRLAGESLGRLTGRIDVEDLLDVVFSQFCIGK
jgi:tRNA modification GTPase